VLLLRCRVQRLNTRVKKKMSGGGPAPKRKSDRLRGDGLMSALTFDEEQYHEDGDDPKKRLRILWADTDKALTKLMEKEKDPRIGDRLNMMWVEKLKAVSGWKKGDWLYAFLKKNHDGGYLDIFYLKRQNWQVHLGWIDLIVEPSGYVCRHYFNLYSRAEHAENGIIIPFSLFIRTSSDYNDYICDKIREDDAKDAQPSKKSKKK
jgi:hypothetical protein